MISCLSSGIPDPHNNTLSHGWLPDSDSCYGAEKGRNANADTFNPKVTTNFVSQETLQNIAEEGWVLLEK